MKKYSSVKRHMLGKLNYRFRQCDEHDEPEAEAEGGLEDFPFNFPDAESVSYENNRIYFYGEVERNTVLSLNKALHKISVGLQNRANELSTVPGNIFLHINSPGGDIFDGFSASDYVRKSKVPVHTIIDGSCASAATFISVVAAKRYINENSFMLIHQLSSQAWGNYEHLKDEMQNLDLLMTTIKNIYKKHTKIPMKKLEEILKKDVWLTADEALKYGLVDEII